MSRDRPSGRPDWQVRCGREDREKEEQIKRNRVATDDKPTCDCGSAPLHLMACAVNMGDKPTCPTCSSDSTPMEIGGMTGMLCDDDWHDRSTICPCRSNDGPLCVLSSKCACYQDWQGTHLIAEACQSSWHDKPTGRNIELEVAQTMLDRKAERADEILRRDKPTGLTDEQIESAWIEAVRADHGKVPKSEVWPTLRDRRLFLWFARRIEAIVRKDCIRGRYQQTQAVLNARKDERKRCVKLVHPKKSPTEIIEAILRGEGE